MSSAAQQRAALRRLTEALAANRPAAEVFQLAVQQVIRLTGAARAAICLLTPGHDMLDYVAVAGADAANIAGLRVRVDDSLAESAVQTGKSVVLDGRNNPTTGSLFPDLSGSDSAVFDPLSAAAPDSAADAASGDSTGSSTRSTTAIVTPLVKDGVIVGALSAMNRTASGQGASVVPFETEDQDLLELFAEIIALSIKNDENATAARETGKQAATLFEAAQTVASTLNVQEVMESVLNAICANLEHNSAIVFLLNDERSHLFIAAERGLSEPEREVQLAVNAGGAHTACLLNGEPIIVDNLDSESGFEYVAESARALSAMVAPLKSRNETHGVIVVTSLQRSAYQTDDLRLLSAVAVQAGVAIDNAFLFDETQRRAEQANALFELSQRMNATLDVDRALNVVADSVMQLLRSDKVAVLLNDSETGHLVPAVQRNIESDLFAAYTPVSGSGIPGWVFEWQTPQAIADIAADQRNEAASLLAFGAASALCVPMHYGDDGVGVLLAMSERRRIFTIAEMELLYTIAYQAASAVSNGAMYKQARERSRDVRKYFNRIAQAIGNTLEAKSLPKLLADLANEIMLANRCVVYRVLPDRVEVEASSGFRSGSEPDPSAQIGNGMAGLIARRGRPIQINDLDDDLRASLLPWVRRERLKSYLGVPVRFGQRVVGVVEVYTTDRRTFSREDVRLFGAFVRRARVAEKLRELELSAESVVRPAPHVDSVHYKP